MITYPTFPTALRVACVFALAFSLTGCAAAARPSFEEVLPGVPELHGDHGRFVFFVPKRARHSAWKPVILLNGEKVGRAVTHGFFYVDRTAGDYEVAHRVTTTVQGKRNTMEERSRKIFHLKKGETLFVQMVLTPGVGFEPRMDRYDPMFLRPVLVEPSFALEELKACRYTGGDAEDEEQEAEEE